MDHPLTKQESEAAVNKVASFLHENSPDLLEDFQNLVADRNEWKRLARELASNIRVGNTIAFENEEGRNEYWGIGIHAKEELDDLYQSIPDLL